MNKKITIFTPTFNRAWILEQAYNSLCEQNFSAFEWVIMDDGSTDTTSELVGEWIKKGKIEIVYKYQKNQGRYSAFNNAKEFFSGDIIVFLDSDDFLLPNALKKISEFWYSLENRACISGILAYFEDQLGEVIGSEFPENIHCERIYDLYDRYNMKGDKLVILRNDLIQMVSYKIYEGEKFSGDSLIFNKINERFPMALIREKIAHREYEGDGMTKNLKMFHKNSVFGMRDHYLDRLEHERCNKVNIIKHMVGYISFGTKAKANVIELFKNVPYKLCFFVLYIPSRFYMLHYFRNN